MDKEDLKRKLKRQRLPMFIIVCIAYMFVTFHRLTPSVMGPTLQVDLGLGASSFAWVGTVYMWTYAICQAPVGTALDSLGTRKGMSILLIMTFIGGCLFATAQNLALLLLGRGIVAFSVSGFMVSGAKVCSKWYTKKEYTTYYPIFMAMGAIGGVFATKPLSWMMGSFGWRWAIIAISIISLVLGIITIFVMRDEPAKVGLPSPEVLIGNAQAETATEQVVAIDESTTESIDGTSKEVAAEKKVGKVSIKTVLAMPILWICGFVALGPNSSGQCLQSLWEGVYLADVYGMTSATIGSILLWSSIGLVLGSILASWIIKKIKISRTLILASVVFLIAWLYMTVKVANLSIVELSVVNFILGVCQMCIITTQFTLIREVMPTDRLGTAMGFLNTFIWIFGAGLFQKIWGWIIASISGGVKPYPVNAFGTCMWLQVVMISLTVIASIVIYAMGKSGKLKSTNLR